ncbi:hypothetical protein MSG28_016059 [Choristoneura fumiferana]|uniref:Uncharacterized protein n=1 Tax=Choristoneura fumiferana TaxID=7141 RepID=A0ACC0K555_CHOFU|nr:hypothetical protein MSG28_016059 [Choristoneura fumiferana]
MVSARVRPCGVRAMDENDDYDSDSTVIISDISKNPEKIARKRRKLDEMVRKILHTNINVTNDAQNKASCVPCANKPTDIKQNHNNDPEAIQRRNNQFLSDCDQLAENNNNDSVFEDLKVKKELLKQENNSEEREYCDGEEVKEKEVVIISDDSEDDCTIVTDDANKQVDKNTNFHPRIGVLTPSAINTRRATLDSEKNAIASNISTCETSANPNKINPKVTVLKPSAINSRRASINSFERNEAPSNNNIKHVNLCRSKSKDKEDNDNKGKEPANKKICKTNRLSGHKSYGEHPPKLTPNQNVISRKRNSDGAIHRKPKNSQDNNIILSSKSTDSNIKDAAAVNKKANRHKSTDSSSVIVRTADVIAKNVQDMSGNQEKVDTGVVDINDPNRTNAGHHKTAQINAMHNVCKDPSVTKNNNINNSINDNVIKIHEASNNVMDQTANLGETPIDIGAFGGSKKENANSTNRRKSTDAKRITVDRNELNANVSDSNINTLEYPILEQSKNTVEKNFVPEEDTDILNSDFNTNKQLSNASKSGTSKSNISVTYDKRKVTDIVVDSLTTTATSAHNDIPTKTNGDTTTKKEKTKEKKKEKSGQSCVTVSNENDEITSEKKGVLKSIQSQSSACLENAISEDKNTKKIANPETKSLGSCAMNKLEESENNEINNPEKARDFVERSREQNFDNTNDQRNVTQNCNDDQKESNQEKKRKNNEEINIIQEAKRATLIKSRRESKIKGHENEFNSTQSHITKLLDTSKEIDKNKQSHIAKDNNNSPVNTEIISEPLHESNVQGGASAVAKTSCQTEVDEAEGERNDIDMDDADDSVCESKLPGTDSSPFVDDRSFTQDEDVISREQNKSKCIFPSTSGSKPTLANCYNCSTNIDVIDMDNHHCRQKIVGTLYNCFSCGVSVQHDDTHKCANENNFCIENVQITDVVTVKEVYVFKCEDCSFATDVYDDVIGHCQNHYNDIKDPTAFCETCQLSYHTNYIKEHEYLHEKDLKIISYSYKSLYSNWDKTFEGMPSHILEEMQERSIYKSHCLKMKVINDGPWKYTLYQCNQCETCVAPGKLEQHCRKECDFLGHPCSECNKLFILYAMCENHELDHKKTNVFKTIEFNCKRDERFNSKLFEARRIETLSRIPIVDIFKCVCGICFISNDSLKHHFAGCNLEDKGVLCPRCAVPRLFEVNDLENHLRLHHGAVAYRFRVNSIVIQEYIETCHILDQDLSKTEDDEREGFKEENDDRSV